MCGPILSIAGTALQGVGAAQGEAARRDTLLFDAQVDDNNALIANQRAGRALDVGGAERAELARTSAQEAGAQRASAAAGGRLVNDIDNSFSNLAADTAVQAELDSLTTAQNTAAQARGLNFQAANLRSDAGRKRGQAGAINPGLAFGTTILGGLGSAFS